MVDFDLIHDTIRRTTDVEKLTQLIKITRSQLEHVSKFAFEVMDFVSIDFKTQGVHDAVIVKINRKTASVVLLSDRFLPRNTRQWRCRLTGLKKLPLDLEDSVHVRYAKVKKELPHLFS